VERDARARHTFAFDQHRRVLDLGGTGSWLLSLLQQREHLQGTLVERAAVDMLREPIPPGHDAVLLAHVLHGFTPRRTSRSCAT
jgi:hypothetical protein